MTLGKFLQFTVAASAAGMLRGEEVTLPAAASIVGSAPWNSPPFSFQHTFNQAGTFNYVCAVHGAAMSGTVIVNP